MMDFPVTPHINDEFTGQGIDATCSYRMFTQVATLCSSLMNFYGFYRRPDYIFLNFFSILFRIMGISPARLSPTPIGTVESVPRWG